VINATPSRSGTKKKHDSQRILFPFLGQSISDRTLEAALRLARAEDATLVPAYVVEVPRNLPLGSPMPGACEAAMPLLESIEQQASQQDVEVDSRIEMGRSARHALRRLLAEERFDRVVVSAATEVSEGLDPEDIAWLLDNAPGEVIVLRPAVRA
jgi:nucleotide-binding universal stress UspA family protein